MVYRLGYHDMWQIEQQHPVKWLSTWYSIEAIYYMYTGINIPHKKTENGYQFVQTTVTPLQHAQLL